jgi:hypothetical protein
MEHVVFFPAADGSPAFRRVPSLDEAVGWSSTCATWRACPRSACTR